MMPYRAPNIKTSTPERTFLVHGEEETVQYFATILKNTHVEIPT